MLSSIGASPRQYPPSTGKSTAVLDGQLAQYQRQLADWVNCPSCSTPEGKAKIAEITAKISDIQQGLKSSDTGKERNSQGQADPGLATANISIQSQLDSRAADNNLYRPFAGSASQIGFSAGRLDVVA